MALHRPRGYIDEALRFLPVHVVCLKVAASVPCLEGVRLEHAPPAPVRRLDKASNTALELLMEPVAFLIGWPMSLPLTDSAPYWH